MARHLIQRQLLEIDLHTREPAHRLQEQIRTLYWERMMPILDRIFSELAGPEAIYRIDKLEIDLGDIPLATLETSLLHQLEEKVRASLHQQIAAADRGARHPATAHARFRSGQKTEALLYFLRTGLFPWYYAGREQADPADLAVAVLDHAPDQLLKGLKALPDPGPACRRMSRQFPEAILERILTLFSSSRTERFTKSFTALRRIARSAPGAVRTEAELWASTLQYQIRGHPNEDAVITGLCRILDLQESGPPDPTTGHWRAVARKDLKPDHPLRPFLERPPDKKSRSRRSPGREASSPRSQPAQSPERAPETEIGETLFFLENAGLVLLAPFLGTFFRKAGLLKGRSFRNQEAQERGVLLTQYLVRGEPGAPEPQLLLNKLLCGWPAGEPVANRIEFTDIEMAESEDLLLSVIQHWDALGNTSTEAFRTSFLQREGRLEKTEGTDRLLVARKGMDVLLAKLPWSISLIKLPWMKKPLSVEW